MKQSAVLILQLSYFILPMVLLLKFLIPKLIVDQNKKYITSLKQMDNDEK